MPSIQSKKLNTSGIILGAGRKARHRDFCLMGTVSVGRVDSAKGLGPTEAGRPQEEEVRG